LRITGEADEAIEEKLAGSTDYVASLLEVISPTQPPRG
jgi:hypothetical protein